MRTENMYMQTSQAPPPSALTSLTFQCLKVLYGGNLLITHDNIIPFLKFGITFQIDELVNICCVWLHDKGNQKEREVFLDSDLEKRLC